MPPKEQYAIRQTGHVYREMLITVSSGDVNPKYSKIDLTEALTPFSLELNDKCPHRGEKRVKRQYLLKKNTGPMENSSFSILAKGLHILYLLCSEWSTILDFTKVQS